MATITKPYTFASGAIIYAAEQNDNFDTIYSDYNGNITNANISSTAAISISKLSGVAASGANTDITSVYLDNTGLKIKDTNATHGLSIVPGSNLTADKTLTITTGDSDRTVTLGGALNTAADFITSGANSLTLTTTGATNVTLPTTGTLLASGGALGTPSSGTLTNCTGLPVAGITASTTTALGVGSVELGHASDTTLSRSSAGVLAVEGVVIPSISSTNTLTNKRITSRVVTTTDDSTAEIDVDVTDQYQLTAMANATTISTTGTPTAGQRLIIRLKDNGTARALTWNAVFRAVGITLPTTTTVNKTTYVGCIYNATDTKWDAVATVTEA